MTPIEEARLKQLKAMFPRECALLKEEAVKEFEAQLAAEREKQAAKAKPAAKKAK